MKKLLSLIAAITVATSGVNSAVAAVSMNATISNSNIKAQSGDKLISDISDLRVSYSSLSLDEKASIADKMAKLSELDTSEISKYLAGLNVPFIREHQETIENMYLLSDSFIKISNSLAVSTQGLDVDWIKMNEFFDLGFGDSTNYTPWVSTYGPSEWWKIWEWGLRIDFPEGDINIMRVVSLVVRLYNGMTFAPLEQFLKSTKTFFDYLINLEEHKEDKLSILYDLAVKTKADFQKSKVPVTKKIYEMLDELISEIEPYKGATVEDGIDKIKEAIEDELGMSIKDIGLKYSDYIDQAINIVSTANSILDIIKNTIPWALWTIIVSAIGIIANQMIATDLYHAGVYYLLEQFIVPLGFRAR